MNNTTKDSSGVVRSVKKRGISWHFVRSYASLQNVSGQSTPAKDRKLREFWSMNSVKTLWMEVSETVGWKIGQMLKNHDLNTCSYITNIMMKRAQNLFYIYLLIFSLVVSIGQCAKVSPFSYVLYSPRRMYRITYSPKFKQSPDTYTVNYPTSPWTSIPNVIYSIVGLTFDRGIDFELTVPFKNTTTLQANLVFQSTISSIKFQFLVMDSDLYPTSSSVFAYTMPAGASGPQSFAITGISTHAASYLTELHIDQSLLPTGFAPGALSQIVISVGNIVKTNLTILYNTLQISIKSMKMIFYDFSMSAFKAVDHDRAGQKFALYGTSGISTDTYMTVSYLSMYSGNYFVGLQAIYDGQFLFGPLSFDITTSHTTKVYYFSSELLFASYYCPSSYPITDSIREYCYSNCEIGFFADAQWICQPCDPNCYKCDKKATNCTACVVPWVLSYGFVCTCPKNMFEVVLVNGTILCNTCSDFISGCYSCESDSICTDCMNNLKLELPATCYCYNGTQLITIRGQQYCVSTNLEIEQKCDDNFYQDGLTCQCTQYYNLTLFKGSCLSL